MEITKRKFVPKEQPVTAFQLTTEMLSPLAGNGILYWSEGTGPLSKMRPLKERDWVVRYPSGYQRIYSEDEFKKRFVEVAGVDVAGEKL